jgi:hypothetical protein
MSIAELIKLIVSQAISVQMNYRPHHERLVAELVDKAGGNEQ